MFFHRPILKHLSKLWFSEPGYHRITDLTQFHQLVRMKFLISTRVVVVYL